MPAPQSRYLSRCNPFVRQWRILVALRRCPQTLEMLALDLCCHERTIRRDLAALAAVPLPVRKYEHPNNPRIVVYRIGMMPEWSRDRVSPERDIAESR